MSQVDSPNAAPQGAAVEPAAPVPTDAPTPAPAKADQKLRICIFIPAYNAATTLTVVLDRIPQQLRDSVDEIFVCDDASQDNTHLIGIGYRAVTGQHNLHIHRHETNKGYGGNQKFAYRYAIDNGYDVVVMLHGDAQYAPEKIPFLLEPFYTGEADMVFGSRMADDPRGGGMPLYKYLGNRFLTFVENLVLRQRLSEYHSGFRVYSTAALKQIPFERCSDDFHFDSEILVQFVIRGLRIVERPIPTYYGDERCYVNVWAYGLNILKVMGEYLMHKSGWRQIPKFDIPR